MKSEGEFEIYVSFALDARSGFMRHFIHKAFRTEHERCEWYGIDWLVGSFGNVKHL